MVSAFALSEKNLVVLRHFVEAENACKGVQCRLSYFVFPLQPRSFSELVFEKVIRILLLVLNVKMSPVLVGKLGLFQFPHCERVLEINYLVEHIHEFKQQPCRGFPKYSCVHSKDFQ